MRYLCFLFCLLLTFIAFPDEKKGNAEYVWPLNINNGYSSAFQEFRSGHFHAGMDLRTFQKTGYPVSAISGGSLVKMRIVKRGSGRGLYIKHHDGKTSIYFHLDRFARKIENIAKNVQKARGLKYFGNYILKKPLSIKKGEVIGFSGETGYGFPHLHLEIRDRDYFAINPFKWLIPPGRDTNFPVLKSLLFRVKESDLINGESGQKIFRFQRINHRSYQLPNPIVFSGKFDLVVNCRDIADTGKYVVPYKISAIIDDQTYFKLCFDRFSWNDNNQLGFVYDMFNSTPGNYFFNLFFQKGFELEEKKIFLDEVIDQLDLGKHTAKIVVEDNFGNQSIGYFTMVKVKKPEIEIQNVRIEKEKISLDIKKLIAQDAGEIRIQLLNRKNKSLYSGTVTERVITENRNFILKGIYDQVCFLDFVFIRDRVQYFKKRFLLDSSIIDDVEDVKFGIYLNRDDIVIQPEGYNFSTDNISLNVVQGDKSQIVSPEECLEGVFFHFKPLNSNDDLLLEFRLSKDDGIIKTIRKKIKLIVLQSGIKQNFRDGDFEAEFDARTVREPKVLRFEQMFFSSDYPVLSRQISLIPYHFPFLDMVRYKFQRDLSQPKQVGIFKYSFRRKKWGYVYTRYDRLKKMYSTKVISSGTFALMRDIFKPEISLLKLRSLNFNRLKRLVVRIIDKGKGVDDSTLKVILNRKRIDCEYDPDWRHVVIENPSALKLGTNILKIQVDDWGGNHSSRTYHFSLK